ncbi:hypothetical protein QM012_008834 [Aureobasidium pullulans]|uniref:Uncharacterized protein n=1 Tax=Aureobasidium pullulans TaxID=5580 RepID=A0ABR0TI98_AURPU
MHAFEFDIGADPMEDRPPRPFVDRVHDWTFRLHPRIDPHCLVEGNDNIIRVLEEWGILARLPEWLAMSAAAFIYGGLHLLAWDAPFHTPIYGLLWKISGITVASLGIIPPLLSVANTLRNSKHQTESRLAGNLLACLSSLIVLVMLLFAPLYVFARVYLVVESCLSLAYLPESVLVTPNFSLYFPHIG